MGLVGTAQMEQFPPNFVRLQFQSSIGLFLAALVAKRARASAMRVHGVNPSTH
jgi:hypothetical protein